MCVAVLALVAGCAAPSDPGEDCAELAQLTTSYGDMVSASLITLEEQPDVSAAQIAAAGDSFRDASNTVGGGGDVPSALREGVDAISVAAQGISDLGLTDQTRTALEAATSSFGETVPGLIESCVASASPTPTAVSTK